MAREPRCTRCQSLGVPSTAEYSHMGETTTRFRSVMPRSRKGVNMGGGGGSRGSSKPLSSLTLRANQRSTAAMKPSSRTFRFS